MRVCVCVFGWVTYMVSSRGWDKMEKERRGGDSNSTHPQLLREALEEPALGVLRAADLAVAGDGVHVGVLALHGGDLF